MQNINSELGERILKVGIKYKFSSKSKRIQVGNIMFTNKKRK